jgi:alpha-L-fucosidase 2
MKHFTFLLAVTLCLLGSQSVSGQSDHLLSYHQPARYFEETLVLGNGKMGAAVFGGVELDKIYLNDATLWSGEPVDPNMNPDAYTHISEIRAALKSEDYPLADSLNRKVQGSFSQSYSPLGTMLIHFRHEGAATEYYRELDIASAVSKVTYQVNGVQFTREYFISHPDQVMIIKLTSSQKGALNFNLQFESLLRNSQTVSANTLTVRGRAPYHTEPNYRGNVADSVLYDENRGTAFYTMIKIRNLDGEIIQTDSSLGLNGGSEAILFISIATSFNGFNRDPAKEGLNEKAMAQDKLINAFPISYSELKSAHLQDYRRFFNRVSLSLGNSQAPDLPTNERLKRYATGKEDKNLEILYFQYGRYLLISSSRTPGVPANLQGIWNPYIRPPWSSNYTVNINVEENYWPAEICNLSEMHEPLLDFIGNIAETGRITARTFYGVGGWAACHNSDIWAMSNPVGDFGWGQPVWANWNMGGTWLSTHLWEHFSFSQDQDFLKYSGYPLMKGAARFCLEWLVEGPDGKLISSPSTSPENLYLTPDGYKGATFFGGTADLAMIRELFSQTISASKTLELDVDFRETLVEAMSRLHPYQVGKKGNLQEWYYDWEDSDPKHRHQSHLFGLFPGHQITPLKTPELAEACRQTLEIKGDETTGWSKGWRINLWARLWDGNRAYKMYRELLKYVDPDEMNTNYSNGGGTYPNLFDAHPPFQIDGNFGGAAAVAEMLLQSDQNEIRLLPALPDAWDTGSVKGLVARGGFEVSIEWNHLSPIKVNLRSQKGGKTTLIHGEKQVEITLQKGEEIEIIWQEKG